MAKKVFVAIVAILTLFTGIVRAQTTPSIQGVWRAVELTITDPSPGTGPNRFPTGTHTNLPTEILILTGKYYSLLGETSPTPRPDTPYKVPSQPTVDEVLSRYGPFTANAGTYEVSGNTLTRHVVIAKNPRTHKTSSRSTIRLEGNNLWLTTIDDAGGTIRYPATVKYVRLE